PAQASVAGTIALIGNILGFVEVLLGMKIFICARFVQRLPDDRPGKTPSAFKSGSAPGPIHPVVGLT
ncbi:MAG: hypothetical protein ACTSUO_09735, partial [Candidatus Thorarchaeota archaeon]